MNVQYRWKMSAYGGIFDVHPVYKDDLTLNYERETGQQFFRAKLSSKITLVGQDAHRVISSPFSTDFQILIQKSTNMGISWSDYYLCHFFKTDCTINEDDLTVSVQPMVSDKYEAVLNGLEKEFNLIELAPAIERINAGKRPMLQVYANGESVVSCLFGGNYFESDRIGDGDPSDYGFHNFASQTVLTFNSQIQGLTTPFFGVYDVWDDGATFYNDEGIYYIQYYWFIEGAEYFNGLDIIRISDGVQVWHYGQSSPSEIEDLPTTITFTAEEGTGMPNVTASRTGINVWGRYVLDVPSFEYQGQTIECSPIESDDIVANNRNYHYMTGYASINLKQSGRLSTTPTEYGRNDAGKYFMPPDDTEQWYPIGQSQWINTSLWMKYDAAMDQFEQYGTKKYQIKDTFPIYSVISVLLAKIAPSVTHQGTAAYSHFLYDDTQVGLPADLLRNTRTFITQKSNVLVGEYKEPAQKAPITLKDVMAMLKNVFNCCWYIDANNRFCIEHISWFKNGGSYGQSPVIGYDLTTMINQPNGKPWAFCTSEYQFDKEDMPARFQYEWMDKSTDLFNGKPINVVSRFVKEDKVEELTVANFTSDIDYMLLASDNCSKDGFALFQAIKVDNKWTLPYEVFYREQYQYRLQNYMVAMIYLQDKFLTYDMPSWNIEVEDEAVTAKGIQRNKKQTLEFPVGENDPDLQKLVKTNIGNGQYDKVAINLSSRTAKVTLKYNTYDQ